MFKIIIISLICVFAAVLVFQQIDPAVQKNNVNNVSDVVDSKNNISVTIEGEVALPGVYKMVVDDTVRDLVTSAGGLLESADTAAINLDIPIESRNYFYVPALNIYPTQCEITTPTEKININKATATQLSTLNYISLSLAEKIVAYREEHGEFSTLEDVMNVSGIGRATYERIRNYITLKWFSMDYWDWYL